MKFVKTALIAALIPVITAGHCAAAVLNNDLVKRTVEAKTAKSIKAFVNGDVSVSVDQLPYSYIEVPDGKVDISVQMNNSYFSPKAIARVNILVNGKEVKTFGVPVTITVQDYVWVASENILRGKAFTASNIKLEKRDISNALDSAALNDFNYPSYLSGKNYRSGEIINKRFVLETPDVIRNSKVSLIFESSFIKMELDGEALEDGKIGDHIRVRNKEYKKDYIGKIISENQVLVKI